MKERVSMKKSFIVCGIHTARMYSAGIIILIAMIGVLLTGCTPVYIVPAPAHPAAVAFMNQIAAVRGGTDASAPVTVKLAATTFSTAETQQGTILGWGEIDRAAQCAEKYIIIDLSDCTAAGNRIVGSSDLSYQSIHSMNAIHDNPYIKGIILPSNLKTIGNNAFYYCNYLTSITILDNVTTIGTSAFRRCTDLTSITIPNSVTSIGDYAFSDCVSLASITVADGNTMYTSENGVLFNKEKTTLIRYPRAKSETFYDIPDSVTTIEASAFYGCNNLTSIAISNTITAIEDSTFYGCSNLTGITIPNSVTSIGVSAFAGCISLTGTTIPDSVMSIGDSAFQNCENITEILIPSGVTTVGSSVFFGCFKLSSVTIPDGVTDIGASAFQYCTSLIGVTIPDSVISIEKDAFRYCTSLTDITVGDGNTIYASENGVLFNKDKTLLMQYPTEKSGVSYSIPPSVTAIGDFVFAYCDNLFNVTIPDSVTSIGNSAFTDCGSLVSVTIPRSVTSIQNYAFYNCHNLISVTFERSGLDLGYSAFYSNSQNLLNDVYRNGGAGTYTRRIEGEWKKQ
jgi:hypothetical protein